MKQPAYEKPEGRDAAVLLAAEEAVAETEVANPELLLSDAELLIVEDELLTAEELMTVEDELLDAGEELLDAGDELLDAGDELLGEEEGVLDAWLWLALSEEVLLELVCDEAEETEGTEEAGELDWLELGVVPDSVVVSVPLADETDEALVLVEDDTGLAEDERLSDDEAEALEDDGEAEEDEDGEAGINFAPEM
jgi:hypothetical protein